MSVTAADLRLKLRSQGSSVSFIAGVQDLGRRYNVANESARFDGWPR